MSVTEAIKTLNSFLNHKYTDLYIKGALDSNYRINRIEINENNQVVIISNSLINDLEDSIGIDL